MKRLTGILIIILISVNITGQSVNKFSIEQVGLPTGNFCTYVFNGKTLTARKNGNIIKTKTLSGSEISYVDSLLHNIGLDTLEAKYSRPVMDGSHWTFQFKTNKIQKEIILNNYYLPNLELFLRKLNTLLPAKKRVISFRTNIHLEPDTLVYLLPDFYIKSEKIPENYSSYNIMCFKKGYFITEILDSIELCDCRIYPKDNAVKRNYWRAWKLPNNTWRREYFDDRKNIIKTDSIKDIIPYQIIKEVIKTDIGTKPAYTIFRYYKTE